MTRTTLDSDQNVRLATVHRPSPFSEICVRDIGASFERGRRQEGLTPVGGASRRRYERLSPPVELSTAATLLPLRVAAGMRHEPF